MTLSPLRRSEIHFNFVEWTADPRCFHRGACILADLADLNKDSSPFWELPQPKPQEIATGLQNKTSVDMSGVTTVEKKQDGWTVKLYIMAPEHAADNPGVLLFIHGASGLSATSRITSDRCAISSSARARLLAR